MINNLTQRFDAIQVSFSDHKRAFEEFVNNLFSSELDYSFILNEELRNRLEKHCLRMAFYRIGLGHNTDDAFENYSVYVYHQLEGLTNYYFLNKYPGDINSIKYIYIEMKIKIDFLRFLRAEEKVDYYDLINSKKITPKSMENNEEAEISSQSSLKTKDTVDTLTEGVSITPELIVDYQVLSKMQRNDDFYKKYQFLFSELKLTYFSKDPEVKKPDDDSFVKRVWKIDDRVNDIERIDFQSKIAVLLWIMNKESNFLKSPIKTLADWRNQELMHTSTKESNYYVTKFKSDKNYLQLFEVLSQVRTFVQNETK